MAEESAVLFERLIHEDPDKGIQLKLVINEFRGVEYLHIRKYFLSFDEGYLPTKEGVAMPCTLDNIFKLLDSLIELCSKEESSDALREHFNHILGRINDKQNTT